MEIQHMLDNLLDSIDWEEAANHSYTNFHAEGVSYVNLLRTDRLTLKLYTFNNVRHNEQGYLVHPHNHGYNFTHQTLCGIIQNHIFSLKGGDDWNMYQFDTPLNGGKGLIKVWPCGLTRLDTFSLPVGRNYYLTTEELHTLGVKTDYAAALLCQFHDVNPGIPTIMLAPAGENPDCETGLYIRMQAWQGRQEIEHFRDEVTKTKDRDNV